MLETDILSAIRALSRLAHGPKNVHTSCGTNGNRARTRRALWRACKPYRGRCRRPWCEAPRSRRKCRAHLAPLLSDLSSHANCSGEVGANLCCTVPTAVSRCAPSFRRLGLPALPAGCLSPSQESSAPSWLFAAARPWEVVRGQLCVQSCARLVGKQARVLCPVQA